jgi:CBS domain-containing protein
MRVYNILNTKGRDIVCVDRGMGICDVAKILAEHNIGAVPMVDSSGEPIGIISERDIIQALALEGANTCNKITEDLMTHVVVTCEADDSIAEIVELMKKKEFRHLPVRGKKGLADIVSMRDVATIRLLELEMENETLRDLLAADAA